MATKSEDTLNCPICLLKYRHPQILPCGHSVCKECTYGLISDSQISCPACHQSYPAKDIHSRNMFGKVLDAVKYTVKKPLQGTTTGSSHKCELGCENPTSDWCEDCNKWLCEKCKISHLEIPSCKDHKVTPLVEKTKMAKDKVEREAKNIRDNIKRYTKLMDKMAFKIEQLQKDKNSTLELSDKLRQEAIEDINRYFNLLDRKILISTQQCIERLNESRAELETKSDDLQTKIKAFEDLIKVETEELAIKTETLTETARMIIDSITLDELNLEDVSIELKKGLEWQASKAALLELKVNGTMQLQVANPISFMQDLSKEALKENKKIALTCVPRAIIDVNEELWICEDSDTIEVFNEDLEQINTLKTGTHGRIHDAAFLPNGDCVLAMSSGLFFFDYKNRKASPIDINSYSSVVAFGRDVFAYSYNSPSICHYVYTDAWQRINTHKMPFIPRSVVSMRSCDNELKVCANMEGALHTVTLDGKILHTLDLSAKRTYVPHLCQCDDEGSVIIAHTKGLCVIDDAGDVRQIRFQDKIEEALSACYINNHLYVISKALELKMYSY